MDDKKKLGAVGVLFVAMLAIGAFQFTKGSGDDAAQKKTDAKPTTDTKSSDSATEKKLDDKSKDGDKKDEKVMNPLLAMPLPTRDPFKPVSLPNPTPSPATTAPAPKVVASGPVERPVVRRSPRLASIPPVQIEGNLPPALPDASNPNQLSGPVGGAHVATVPEAAFGYRLKGTLMGNRPMAVFADSQGNERIVPVGSSLDGDSKVVSVQPGAVQVRVHGKTKTMTPGGNE